eukprot:CAMPEP_0178702538 /NCGR_PEP_ID=MMETSP0699-20121125/12956_1 /TAXON_ID=265572 /ORGANISM="Extubocellulus spinifer, Strain CCMP396" /LENGTH=37 /DNA_ID= /DNA_START= /DNA_END= /DNA_ORIENTATION=
MTVQRATLVTAHRFQSGQIISAAVNQFSAQPPILPGE